MHPLRLAPQEARAGPVQAQDGAGLVDGQDSFLHAGEHCFALVLLAEHGLNPFVQLARHAVQCVGHGGDLLGTGDRQPVAEVPGGEPRGPGLDLFQRAAHAAGNHQAHQRVREDAHQRRREELAADDAQSPRQVADGQGGPHHRRRRPGRPQRNRHVDPLLLLGGAVADRLAGGAGQRGFNFGRSRPRWFSMRGGPRPNRRSPGRKGAPR